MPRPKQTKAPAPAPEPAHDELEVLEEAEVVDPIIPLEERPEALAAFRDHVRGLLLGGIPGNELRGLIVHVFDSLDDERVAAVDRDGKDPIPQVRM